MKKDSKIKENEEEEEPIINLNLSLSILTLVTSYQQQNGLRQKDYERYIKFCGKKISKLRQDLKITQGKKKFNKIEINEKNTKDSSFLLIQLLDTERRWALGAQYNQRLTEADSIISDWRYKTKIKYYQATEEAKKLLAICTARCDSTSCLEAEAYFNSINANYLIFVRKFKEGLESYKIAKEIYSKLQIKKDSIEQFTYKEKIKFINLQIRFCEYNLGISKEENFAFNQAEEDQEQEEEQKVHLEIKPTSEDPFEPQFNLEKSSNKDQVEITVRYQLTQIPIKNENLKNKILKIEELTNKIKFEEDFTKKQNIFSDVFNLCDDCYKIIKTERADSKQENLTQIFNKLISYFSMMKINFQVWKTNLYLEQYKLYYIEKNILVDLLEKDNCKLSTKPQEMIKLYDNLAQYFSQTKSNEKEFLDENTLNCFNFKEKICSVFKVYYTSFLYLQMKRLEEPYNLLYYFKQQWLDVLKTYELNKYSKKWRDLDSLISDGKNLDNYSSYAIQKLYVKINIDKQPLIFKKLKKEEKDKKGIKCSSWLYSSLKGDKESISVENYEIFKQYTKIDFNQYHEAINKQTYNSYTHLIQFPPNFQILYPKPISFDLINNHLNYPDLTSKFKKEEKKSLVGRTLGYFFGK